MASKVPCQPESMLMKLKPCDCKPDASNASDWAVMFAWVRKLLEMVSWLKLLQPRYGLSATPGDCAWPERAKPKTDVAARTAMQSKRWIGLRRGLQ